MSLPVFALAYGRMRRAQWLSCERLAALQLRKLQAIMAHAYDTVPFYRRRLETAGITPADIRALDDLRHLPVTTKAELQQAGEEARLSRAFRRDELEAERTSGSTGRPFMIFRDPGFVRLSKMAFLRALTTGPYRLGDRLLLVTGTTKRPPPRWLRWRYVSSEAEPEATLAQLRAFRPRVVYGFLTPLRQLAALALARGEVLPPVRAVYTTAESLDGASRALLAEAFGAEVFDIYGTTELGATAWECPAHAGYHVAEDLTLVEYLPSAAPDVHRLVATNLELRAMPLIRYEVGDLAAPASGDRCPCGRMLARIARIEGRLVDCVQLADGRRLSPFRLTLAVEAIPGIERYQIVQEEIGRFLVRVQGSGAGDPATAAAIRAALQAEVGVDSRVDLCWEVDLGPPAGCKFRVVECKIGSTGA